MKLYELNEEIYLAENEVDLWAEEHEGDVTDCPFDKILDGLKIEKDEKLLSLAAWFKNINSDAKAIAEEIKILTNRKRVISNKAERIKDYVSFNLESGKKLSDSKIALSWRKSQSVSVECEAKDLPSEYQKIEISANKTDLKNALKAGEAIEGVTLSDNLNLQIK